MDNCILVNVNLFNMEHSIFIITDEGIKSYGTATYANLPSILIGLSQDMGINNIKLAGNSQYAFNLVNEIKEHEMNLYSENKINIEVI